MGMDLSPMLQEWTTLFSALAQVSGGLVGLVFVALTFNPQKLSRGGDPMLAELARVTFTDFLVLLFVSLVMLVPRPNAFSVAGTLLGIGGLATLRMARSLVRLRAHMRPGTGAWQVVQRFTLSVLGHLLLLAVGVMLLAPKPDFDQAGSFLFSAVSVLLLSASRSAWLLVIPEGH
jgi:hypothetical protein